MSLDPIAGPAGNHGRIPLVDSIRALALLGVIIMNVSAMQMLFIGRELMADAGPADIGVMLFDLLLIQGKARACFAFLFGFGFSVMLMRAEARGADFRSIYARRMFALLAFGLVNQVFLWWGDILFLYALLGFGLLPLRHLSDRVLLTAGLVLVIGVPLLIGTLESLLGGPLPNIISTDLQANGLVALTSGNYADFIRFSWPLVVERRLADTVHMFVYDTSVFGLFLLGSWAARRKIATEVDRHRSLLRRIALVCIPLGLVLSAVSASRMAGFRVEGAGHGLVTAASAGLPILAFGYLAAAVLLFARGLPGFQRVLAPAGRLALTNYLASSVIGCWFFYGYGLDMLGRIGLAETNLLAVGIFLGLLAFSHLWLARFRMGPMEWLWRLATYGRTALPLRPAKAPG